MADEERQKFELRKVYVKDISFESPMAPAIFTRSAITPGIEVALNVDHNSLGEELYESVLTVTVNGKLEDRHAFLAEVQQAGVYQLAGFGSDEGLTAVLEMACPNMLFPFAREAINDLVVRGGFPQLLLSPMNFETLYRRKRQAAAAAQNGGSATADSADSGADPASA